MENDDRIKMMNMISIPVDSVLSPSLLEGEALVSRFGRTSRAPIAAKDISYVDASPGITEQHQNSDLTCRDTSDQDFSQGLSPFLLISHLVDLPRKGLARRPHARTQVVGSSV